MIKIILFILAVWCWSLTIALGLLLNEYKTFKDQVNVAQKASAEAMYYSGKFAGDYSWHLKIYQHQIKKEEEIKNESAK
jgi:hypothetical protein